MTATSRNQRWQATHDRIITVALDCFSQGGYRGTPTREIARAAGITEVTLFRHFASKEILYQAVVERHSILPVIKEFPARLQHAPLEEQLLFLARNFLAILDQRQSLVRLVLAESLLDENQARMMLRAVPLPLVQFVSGLLETHPDTPPAAAGDCQLAARSFIGSLLAWFLMQNLLGGGRLSSAPAGDVAGTFTRIFLHGFLNGKDEPC